MLMAIMMTMEGTIINNSTKYQDMGMISIDNDQEVLFAIITMNLNLLNRPIVGLFMYESYLSRTNINIDLYNYKHLEQRLNFEAKTLPI